MGRTGRDENETLLSPGQGVLAGKVLLFQIVIRGEASVACAVDVARVRGYLCLSEQEAGRDHN